MPRLLAITAITLAFLAGVTQAAPDAALRLDGTWVGTYTLGGPGSISVGLAGKRATVVLGVGHADLQTVALSAAGDHVRFTLPGRPQPVVFDARLKGAALTGTVRQGATSGSFQAKRGSATELIARGFYRAGGRALAVVDDPYGPARLVDLETRRRARAVSRRGAVRDRIRVRDSRADDRQRELHTGRSTNRRSGGDPVTAAAARGALPKRHRIAFGNAHHPSGWRSTPRSRVRPWLWPDRARVPPRSPCLAAAPRHCRARVRQAWNRTVGRAVPRRVSDRVEHRRSRP